MSPIGISFIVITSLLPLYWYWPLFPQDPGAVFSQYIGSVALILMGYVQLIATRAAGLERVFGSMDRIYVLHKWLGIIAMVTVLIHDTIDAEMRGLPETALTEIAETLGEISLYGLLILVTITLLTFVPYHLWKWTHKFMGAFFAASALHFIFIMKPFDMVDPLGLYIGFFCLIGCVCYAWTLRPARGPGRGRAYTIDQVSHTGGATEVRLTPQGRGIKHRSGQFVVLKVDAPGLEEAHPFTLSAAPTRDRQLSITIKALGDYTRRVAGALEPGTTAQVEGPFGHFTPSQSTGQVWIAAGIGITPFLAWADARTAESPPVHLIYCVKNRAEAPHLERLEALAAQDSGLTLTLRETANQGRLSAREIPSITQVSMEDMHVAFCGPKPMGKTLRDELRAQGLKAGRFRFEEFEFRSGLPVDQWVVWLIARFWRRNENTSPVSARG